jgi:hypothetical protein
MAHYRFYCMTRDGHFTDIHEITLPDDAAAITEAEGRLAGAYAIDVFCDGRRVGRVESEEAKSSAWLQGV